MSSLPNGITHTAHATRNGVGEHVSFHMFFDSWIVEQNHHLQELVSTAASSASEVSVLIPLVEQVVQHYEHYYKTKSMWAKKDILSMFRPSWTSSLEKAYMWVGGWRPTMAFHLLYSKCGLQFKDTGDLSHGQMERVDKLHKTAIWKEKMITEKLAKLQETTADSSMVELTHSLTKFIRHGGDRVVRHQGLVDEALAPKEKGLVGILQMADELRLNTLKELILILSPIQGVYFLIAAAELHLRMHDWGKKRDDASRHHHQATSTANNK